VNDHVQTDINAASYLLQRGFRLLDIRHVSGNRYAFVFDDPQQAAAGAVAAFLTDTPAPAQSLLNCFRSLKAQLFSIRQKYEYEHPYPSPRR
jgi:hypothetical protein